MSDVVQQLNELVILAYVIYRKEHGETAQTKQELRNYRQCLMDVCQKRGGTVAQSTLAVLPHTPLVNIQNMFNAARGAWVKFQAEHKQEADNG